MSQVNDDLKWKWLEMNQDVISLGEVLWDLFPEGAQFGGAPANFASHAAHLGASVSMFSAVGDDELGRKAVATLNSFNVDTTCIQTIAGKPTGTVGISLDDAGKPTFTIHQNSAWDFLTWDNAWEQRLQAADVVYFGTLSQRVDPARGAIRRAVQTAAAAGAMRIVDINLRAPFYNAELVRDSIGLASILKLSLDELADVCNAFELPEPGSPSEAITQLRAAAGLELVVMTNGADGAMLATEDDVIQQPGIPAVVVDTVGAGDSFTAAFITGLLRGEPHHQILENACKLAADVCSHAGAAPRQH